MTKTMYKLIKNIVGITAKNLEDDSLDKLALMKAFNRFKREYSETCDTELHATADMPDGTEEMAIVLYGAYGTRTKWALMNEGEKNRWRKVAMEAIRIQKNVTDSVANHEIYLQFRRDTEGEETRGYRRYTRPRVMRAQRQGEHGR